MARGFNGSSDTAQVASSSPLSPTTQVTCAAWFYTTANAFQGLITKPAGVSWSAPYADYALDIISAGTTNVRGFITDSHQVIGSTIISLNAWHHAAFTYDHNIMLVYLDGVQDGTLTPGALTIGTGGQPLWLGSNISVTSPLTGRIADAAVWNTALVASEISSLSKGTRALNIRSGSLVGYWPLDGLSSPEPDLSGNKGNATLSGTALAAGPPIAPFTPRWPQFTPAAAATTKFRKTLLPIGTRIGSRQTQMWG